MLLLVVGAIFFRSSASKEKAAKIRKDAHDKAQKVLDEANEEALTTIKRAAVKARELIEKATFVSERANKILSDELHTLSQKGLDDVHNVSLKFVETYEQMASSAQNDFLEAFQKSSQVMTEDAKKTAYVFEKYLKDQTVEYKESMEKRLQEFQAEAQDYIDAYRERRLAKVDAIIFEIIQLTSKNVLGRIISTEEHDKLILQALEEAKKEGFFSEFHA